MVSANYNVLNSKYDRYLVNKNITPVSNNIHVRNKTYCNNLPQKDRITFTSNLLTKGSKLITKEVINSIKKENFLGNGVEGEVYKIPNTEYCVKILSKNNDLHTNNWRFDITPQEKINHVVAISDNGNTIMKHLQGEALDLEEKPDSIYFLPKNAYKKLIKQIDEANKIGMVFDNAPMNIIFNPCDKSLTAIDFYKCSGLENTPIFDIYTTLYNVPSNHKLAKSLSERLLSLSLDEIEKGAKSEIPLSYKDISSLIAESKKYIEPNNEKIQTKFEELKQLYKRIFELRESKQYNSEEYIQAVNTSRELVNEIMC